MKPKRKRIKIKLRNTPDHIMRMKPDGFRSTTQTHKALNKYDRKRLKDKDNGEED